MGEVYVAEHKTLPRRFAVKFLKVEDASEELLARFEREARIASGLAHPNIVDVVDFDETSEGRPFIVMEMLEGEDLASRIRSGGPMSPEALRPLSQQICAALSAAGKAGIIHRDLKPQNIFLQRQDDGEVVKILDFGISKIETGDTELTAEQTIMGTPHYMAPEQIKSGAAAVDGRADLFALGAILYECLTAELAFPGDSFPEVVHAVCYGERPALREKRPELSEDLECALSRLMEADPEVRYPDVQSAWQDLQAALPGGANASSSALDATVALGEAESVAEADTVAPASATELARTTAEQVERPRLKQRSWAVIGAFLVAACALGVLAWRLLGQRTESLGTAAKPPAPSAGVQQGAVEGRASRRTHVPKVALIKVKCGKIGTSLVESLREAKQLRTRNALLPQDEVDKAVRQLSGDGLGIERPLGKRVVADLVLGGRCDEGKLISRLVQVSDGAVLLKRVLSKRPTLEEVRDLDVAIWLEWLKALVRYETRSPDAARLYIQSLRLMTGGFNPGNTPQILRALHGALKADPSWERIRVVLADMYTVLYMYHTDDRMLRSAEKLLRKPTRLKKGFVRYRELSARGMLAFWKLDLKAARDYLAEAILIYPEDLKDRAFLAMTYGIAGQDELCEQTYQQAIQHSPGFGHYQVNLASLLLASGRLVDALKSVAPAIVIQDRQRRLGQRAPQLRMGSPPVLAAHATRGYVLLAMNRPEEARRELLREIDQNRGMAYVLREAVTIHALFGLGIASRMLGQRRRAKQAFVRAEQAWTKALKTLGRTATGLTAVVETIAVFEPRRALRLIGQWTPPTEMDRLFLLVARVVAMQLAGQRKAAKRLLDQTLAAEKRPLIKRGINANYARYQGLIRAIEQHRRKKR